MYQGRATVFTVVLLTVGALLLSIRPAHAYIDLGSGAYFFQMAIAAALGVAFALKGFWVQTWNRIKKPKSSESAPVNEPPKDETTPSE